MQSAAFVGLRAGGVRGALAAYAGFGLPAVVFMVAASAAYGHVAGLALVQAGFLGFRAMIVALVANAAFECTRAPEGDEDIPHRSTILEGVKSCPTWSKEVSVFDWKYDATETCYVMEGEVKVTTPEAKRWNSARAIWSLSRAG